MSERLRRSAVGFGLLMVASNVMGADTLERKRNVAALKLGDEHASPSAAAGVRDKASRPRMPGRTC